DRANDRPGLNREASAETVTLALAPALTRAFLTDAGAAYQTEPRDLLLAALALALYDWTGETRVQVDLEGHGREAEVVAGADLARTVGWFTALYPVALALPGAAPPPGEVIRAVKEQLRAVPRRGLGYGVLRWLDEGAGERLGAMPESELLFEYFGRTEGPTGTAVPGTAPDAAAPFAPAAEQAGATADPLGRREYLIAVWAAIAGDELQVAWTYSRNL